MKDQTLLNTLALENNANEDTLALENDATENTPTLENDATKVSSLAAYSVEILMKEVDRAWDASAKKVEGRIDQVILQCERFEWLADDMRDEVSQLHSITAAAVLVDPASRTSDIERALVSLALKATADSGILLNAYQPPKHPEKLGLLHQIVRIEWENRWKKYADAPHNDDTSTLFSA